jgi:hypothetical protein
MVCVACTEKRVLAGLLYGLMPLSMIIFTTLICMLLLLQEKQGVTWVDDTTSVCLTSDGALFMLNEREYGIKASFRLKS